MTVNLWTRRRCVFKPRSSVNVEGHLVQDIFLSCRWYFWCDTSLILDKKTLAHMSQINLSPVPCSNAWCSKNCWGVLKALSHSEQKLLARCISSISSFVIWWECLRCWWRTFRWTYSFPQYLHLKSKSPSCFFLCFSNKLQFVNFLPHPSCSHKCGALLRCWSIMCSFKYLTDPKTFMQTSHWTRVLIVIAVESSDCFDFIGVGLTLASWTVLISSSSAWWTLRRCLVSLHETLNADLHRGRGHVKFRWFEWFNWWQMSALFLAKLFGHSVHLKRLLFDHSSCVSTDSTSDVMLRSSDGSFNSVFSSNSENSCSIPSSTKLSNVSNVSVSCFAQSSLPSKLATKTCSTLLSAGLMCS